MQFPLWGSLILSPIIGILIDRIGSKWLFVTIGCAGSAVLVYLIPWFTGQVAILPLLLGIFVAILVPAVFSLPAELLPERVMGFGFGIITTMAGIGMALGPYLVGFLRDITGTYLWSFAAMAIFSALGVIPMLLLKRQLGKTKRNLK